MQINNLLDTNIKLSYSRMFLSGIFNACGYKIKGKTPELVSGSSTHTVAVVKQGNPLFNQQQTIGVEDPGQKPSGMTPNFITANTRGFTLIELLVVVLIIGILAAVALPQYQKAVLKARLTKVIPVVHALKNAEEIYYLANGHYTENEVDDKLDIDEIANCTRDGVHKDVFLCNGFFINVHGYGKATSDVIFSGIGNTYPKELGYIAYQDNSPYPGRRECIAYAENKLANEVCKSMGGTEDGSYAGSVSYFQNPFTRYVLP